MVKRVTLDAMIPREDFAIEGEEFVLDLFPAFPVTNLSRKSPILKLLRKPDFQRETNHWSPEQVATFIASFLDNEVIPSLILWKSPSFVFVIDGGHRLGGSVSPVDALGLLIEFLVVAGTRESAGKAIEKYADDTDGAETIAVLHNALDIVRRITGNSPESLGLHPAVYFYNERGKYNRFLFLGMTLLLVERVRNNDSGFFKKFTLARAKLEAFLMSNKSLLGILLQNMGKTQRVPKMRDLLSYLIAEINAGRDVLAEQAISHLGLRGRIIDVVNVQTSPHFTDATKATLFIRKALDAALVCPVCGVSSIQRNQFRTIIKHLSAMAVRAMLKTGILFIHIVTPE
jgi:Protein of unknown function DUF262